MAEFEHLQFLAQQPGLEAIRKAREKRLLAPPGHAGDDAHGSTRMDERVVAAMHAYFGDDLSAGVDVIGLVRHVLGVVSSSDRL